MTASVLVATPHQAFGELLRLSLEEEGRYRVHLVHSAREAAGTLTDQVFNIAILDGELKDMRVSELGRQLLAHTPGLKLVLIPPENDPKHPLLAGMVYHGYILRPFYLPDLLDMMESLSEEPSQAANTNEEQPAGTEKPAAMQLDAKNFEGALAATSALAGIVQVGSEQTLIRGELPEAVEGELETLVRRALSNGERTDLVRFVRLSGQNTDHLFYITPVAENITLGLAYPVGTPLSRVRTQAGQVVEALRPIPPMPKPKGAAAVRAAVRSWVDGSINEENTAPDKEEMSGEEGENLQEINLAAMLGSVPAPNPGESPPSGWVPEINMSLPRPESEAIFPWEENSGLPAGETETAAGLEDTRPVVVAKAAQMSATPPGPASKSLEERVADLEATRPVPVAQATQPVAAAAAAAVVPEVKPHAAVESGQPEAAKTTPPNAPQPALALDEPPVNELEDTRPRVLTNLTNFQQLVPASPAYSLLNYTCVLIPRLPQHHLTGGLSAQAGQWVQQLCLAFGWRLEGIAIRPEYLQWTVQVSPSIAPANLIRILRGRISNLIFENHPSLAKQNPSGDFWATGYLIVSGMQPPSPRLLRDYIAETRRRQGLSYPEGEPLVQASSEPTSLLDGSQAPFRAY